MSNERVPDFAKCVARPMKGEENPSWCGRNVSMEWHFTGLDHAAAAALKNDRLMICSGCLDVVTEAMRVHSHLAI